MRPPHLVRLFVLALCGAPLAAQQPSSWVSLPLSAPYSATNVMQLGKTCAYLDGTTLWFFSGFAKAWYSTPVTSASTSNLRVYNDLSFYVDGTTIIAFSSYRGAIEKLQVSASHSIVNPATQRNDSILTVVDGTQLWTFACFEGKWKSRALTSATPRIVTQRHVLLVAEGTTFSALSAFDGTWATINAAGTSTAAYADGSWGVVETSSTIYGFSAQRAQWSSAPALSGTVTSQRREDCIVYTDATTSLAYTGLRGAFATYVHPAGAQVTSDALVVAAQNGTTIGFFSAVLGSWSTFTTATPAASITVRPHCATVFEAGVVSAYSPFLGTVATLPVGASSYSSNDGVASAIDLPGVRLWLYSALTGAWSAAPVGTIVSSPGFIWCGALVKTATGYAAFSGRSGRYFPIAASGAAIAQLDFNSSVMAVEDTTTLSIFESRRETWLTIQKVNPAPLQVRIWRTTLLAVDGSTVHGYCTFAGRIESHALPGAPTEFNANSESVRAGVGSTLACYGGTPEIVTHYQFPEFRRVFAMGSTLGCQLHAKAGAQAWALLGTLGPVAVPVPPYGQLFVDGATMIVLPIGALPADGRASLSIPVPDVPVLRRLELCLQGFVQPASGSPYLTSLASVLLN